MLRLWRNPYPKDIFLKTETKRLSFSNAPTCKGEGQLFQEVIRKMYVPHRLPPPKTGQMKRILKPIALLLLWLLFSSFTGLYEHKTYNPRTQL